MTNEDIIKEFEQLFFVKNGELEVETYLDVKDFLLTQLEAKDALMEKIVESLDTSWGDYSEDELINWKEDAITKLTKD